jgi:hypothetical protein
LKEPDDSIYIIYPEDGESIVKINPKGCAENICLQICHICHLLKKRRILGDIPVGFGGILWVHLPCSL